jgi:ABC-type branched-subunit amino acid transport system substrate-binding protein
MLIFKTAGDPIKAEAAAKKAISQNVKLIIGPLFAKSAESVGKIAAANNINVLSFSNTSSIAGNNVFILGNSFQNTSDRLLGFAYQKGYSKISVVLPDTEAGRVAANSVKLSSKSNNLNFVGSYDYPFSADGIAENAYRITRKIRRSDSDAVVLTADSASGLPLLAEFLLAKGLPIKDIKILGLSRWDIPQSTLNTPGLRNGWFTVPDGAAINDFNKRFKKVYGVPPHPLAGFAYDGMKIFATLLSEGNSGAAQRSQLTRPQGFKGASGAFRLLNNGSAQRALSIAEASAGALRIISPAPTRFGGSGAFLYEITN